jgi:hypothetical protein
MTRVFPIGFERPMSEGRNYSRFSRNGNGEWSRFEGFQSDTRIGDATMV